MNRLTAGAVAVLVVAWAAIGTARVVVLLVVFPVVLLVGLVGLGTWIQLGRKRAGVGAHATVKAGLAGALGPRSSEEGEQKVALHARVDGQVARAVDRLLDNVIRDFVLKWYHDIAPEAYVDSPDSYSDLRFPLAVDAAIRHSLRVLLGRLDQLDLSKLVIGKILPLVTQHLEAFRLAEAELRGGTASLSPGQSSSEEMDLLIARKHAAVLLRLRDSGRDARPGLHPAVDVPTLNSQITEHSHLRGLFGQILPLLLPPSLAASPVVGTVAKELVACAVVGPVIELLTDPDFYNRLVVEKAGAALREQKMVEQLREALEKQSAAATSAALSPTVPAATASTTPGSRPQHISPTSTLRDFERFSRSISRCASLFDARRIRNDIDTQIRKTETSLADPSHHDDAPDLRLFLERLQPIRELADHRILELGGASGPSPLGPIPVAGTGSAPKDTLLRILNDRESQALSYFTEFLDRRHRVSLLQFWLAVEGLKDPLEDLSSPNPASPSGLDEAVKDDLKSIADVYFRVPATVAALGLRPSDVEPLEEALTLLDDPSSRTAAIRNLRKKLFVMQSSTFDRLLAEDFPAFASSDLFLKATASLTSTRPNVPPPVAPPAIVPPPSPNPSRSRPMPAKSSSAVDIVRPRSPLSGQHALWRPGAARRTTTAAAAPQISLQAAFDERPPGQRLTGDHQATGSRGATKVGGSTASLDFLIGATTEDRTPLFADEPGTESEGGSQASSRPSTRHVSAEMPTESNGEGVTIALQEALSSIISTADAHSPRIPSASRAPSNPHLDGRPGGAKSAASSRKPSPSAPFRKGLFDEDDVDDSGREDSKTGQFDAPVSLTTRITTIADADSERVRLDGQLQLLDGLMRKAELTGHKTEMRLLARSIHAVTGELEQVAFRRSQLEAREYARSGGSARLVPGRVKVSIAGTSIGRSEGTTVTGGLGTQFVVYLVEVHQLADDGAFASGWIVTRRYSEFSTLRNTMRERYPIERTLDFPAKTLSTGTSALLVEQRKAGLDKYLKALVRIPVLCQSPELAAFLSRSNISLPVPDVMAGFRRQLEALPGHGLIRSFYSSLTAGLSAPSLLEALIGGLRQQAVEFASLGDSASHPDDILSPSVHEEKAATMVIESPGVDALAALSVTMKPLEGEGVTTFTAPICDLIVEVFELNDKNQWLRKQGIVIVLQQILGSAIERKLRDAVTDHLSNEAILQIIASFEAALWPDGRLRTPSAPRTAEEKARSRDASYRQLMVLMPDLAASVLGKTNARRGARRLFAVYQNQRLNRHLAYCVLDELIRAVFPEVTL